MRGDIDDLQGSEAPILQLKPRIVNGFALVISGVVNLVCYEFLELSNDFIKLDQQISAG